MSFHEDSFHQKSSKVAHKALRLIAEIMLKDTYPKEIGSKDFREDMDKDERIYYIVRWYAGKIGKRSVDDLLEGY